ncbi:hypothetical protein CSHISOI_11703 [Colletotrichum shisoi]|uniref:Uncharacterized protein n=1 Tax=Colletotrichum shisoi TaxID=2078593 RepID=A0A5Q4BAV1_9PEZI|nr:hypothetical protein CSHISOI_11703 [Colletotrichum shisoi]
MVADDDPPATVSLVRYVYHDRLQPLKPQRLSTDKRVVGAGQVRHGRTTAEPAVMTPRPVPPVPPVPPPPCLEADGGSRTALDSDSDSDSNSAADAPRRLPGPHLEVQPRLVVLPLPLLPQPLAQRLLGLADVRKPLRPGPRLRLRLWLRLRGRRHGPPLARRIETPRGGALARNHGRVRGAAHRRGAGSVTYTSTSTSKYTALGRASRYGARVGGFAVVPVRPSRAVTPRGVALVGRAELARGDDQGVGGARGRARGVETGVQGAVKARGLGRVGAGSAGALVGDAVSGCRRVREVCGRLGTGLAVAGVFGMGGFVSQASVDRVDTAWRETGSRQV